MYSILISNFSSILNAMNKTGQAYEEKMQTVRCARLSTLLHCSRFIAG